MWFCCFKILIMMSYCIILHFITRRRKLFLQIFKSIFYDIIFTIVINFIILVTTAGWINFYQKHCILKYSCVYKIYIKCLEYIVLFSSLIFMHRSKIEKISA